MHTVFLVEDEPVIRQNIRKTIERNSDRYSCVGEAGDGELALSIIRDLRPDILITDIKMPFMDGLALARHSRAIVPWLRIIIVSGYNEFELAREAITVGVDHYLLKPVAGTDLLTALQKASDQIAAQKRHSLSFTRTGSDEEVVRTALISALLEELCGGKIDADETFRRAEELGIDILGRRYLVMVAVCEGRGEFPDRNTVVSRVRFVLAEEPEVLYFFSGVDHVVMIVKGDDDTEVTERAYHTAQNLKHELEDDRSVLLTVSISSVTGRIFTIRDAYQEASILLNTFRQTHRGRVFRAGDLSRIESPVATAGCFNLNIENKLKFALAADVPRIVSELGSGGAGDEMQGLLYRYYILMDLTNTAIRILRDFNPDSDPAQIARHFAGLPHVFQSAMSAEEFEGLATAICLRTIELRDRGNSSHHAKLVRRACRYIEEHFNHPDISLTTVASHVALSPTHFSTIFSQEMSVTFIEHLTQIRMNRVKELLATGDEKVVNIAFEVGYNDPNYLGYLFKKREGVTPKEYRQMRRVQPGEGAGETGGKTGSTVGETGGVSAAKESAEEAAGCGSGS